MAEKSVGNIKIFLCSLLILSGLTGPAFSKDKQISGIINTYRRVVAFPDNFTVTLDKTDGINPGDTVLIIQMKGVIIDGTQTENYGKMRNYKGSPGSSEFLIVSLVNQSTKLVTFTNNIKLKYDVSGVVQLVRVPSYNSATVTGELTCQPWDSTQKTGGILVMMVSRNLTLKANIDVSGKGFAGGAVSIGSGTCVAIDPNSNDKVSYPSSYANSGLKGESPVIKVITDLSDTLSYFPGYARGKGGNFTGGGGGNGRFSGGGGGSNYGTGTDGGGQGGFENSFCTPIPYLGGSGGKWTKNSDIQNGLFFGGGGGSSTFESGSTASPGSKGGGIVIILCDTLKGNGNSIKADGGSPVITASGNAGAGGGGGGGSVAIWLQSFSASALAISANGGNGGSTSSSFGEGGGGGGGLIKTNLTIVPSNVKMTVSRGEAGVRNGGVTTGTAGYPGGILTNFAPVLSGFLYNFIYSSSTLDETDSICYNTFPPRIKGTKPTGGTPPYIFKWEKSYDKNFLLPEVIPNTTDSVNYTPIKHEPTSANNNVYFRRTITDASAQPWSDVSRPVTFIIQPAIKNNTITGSPDSICFAGDPPLMKQMLPDLILPSKANVFTWQTSTDAIAWISVLSSSVAKEYDPPSGLKTTSLYRRVVNSGRCVDTSSFLKITVLPEIKNTITGDNSVCYKVLPGLLKGDPPFFGVYPYSLAWQNSQDLSAWNFISGATSSDYQPPPITSDESYRRIVYLGKNDLCKDTSKLFTVKVNPLPSGRITNSLDTIICYGSASKVRLKVHLTGKSKWNLVYSGNLKDSPVLNITGTDTTIMTALPAVSDSALFKYYLKSLNDANGCIPDILPDTLNAHVYKTPFANAGQDATVCGSKYKLQAIKSIGNGLWNLPPGAAVSSVYDPSAMVLIDSTYSGGNKSFDFTWKEINGKCSSQDMVTVNFEKRINPVRPGSDTLTLVNTYTLDADPLQSWESGKWSLISGTGKIENETNNITLVTGLSAGLNSFQWRVTNGQCTDEATFKVYLDAFIPQGFSPNNDSYNNTFIIDGLDPVNQTSELRILNGAGQEVYYASKKKGETKLEWDGLDYNGKVLPDGTYYYLLKIISGNNSDVFKRSGFVVLKRY